MLRQFAPVLAMVCVACSSACAFGTRPTARRVKRAHRRFLQLAGDQLANEFGVDGAVRATAEKEWLQIIDATCKGLLHARTDSRKMTKHDKDCDRDEDMTTQEAADFLRVSRPFVVKLVKEGKLPATFVGRFRRIPRHAVEEYREQRYAAAEAAAGRLARLATKKAQHRGATRNGCATG
ncbi:MAG TPA: helix-turn-helix domain-containing protein [Gemmataceae bacterium]|nr:helix-turn-helix domain-containing protein [Gemmataceae bacterium]